MARPNTRSSTAAVVAQSKRKAEDEPKDSAKPSKKSKPTSSTTKASPTETAQEPVKKPRPRAREADRDDAHSTSSTARIDTSSISGPNYYLMKAEPNTRLENGIDVKFSIDDLRAVTSPRGEPWEGVRNYVARNNMMAMKKGELAFFYHSNCKVPGIAGIMEVVEENCVDESAFDPKHPYYDPKSSKEKPRWFMSHVAFKRKFDELVALKELQALGGLGTPLQNMQLLKQSRLSVSKVSKAEWDYIMELVEKREGLKKDAMAEES